MIIWGLSVVTCFHLFRQKLVKDPAKGCRQHSVPKPRTKMWILHRVNSFFFALLLTKSFNVKPSDV